MDRDKALREHLVWLLGEGDAHVMFDRAIQGIPKDLRGAMPEGIPHTPWRLLEHMRLCQWDILEFSRNPQHVSPEFPDGYWPEGTAPPSDAAWDESVDRFRADLQTMQELVADENTDLFTPLPHGDGHTVLREAMLVADHNAYHIGQLMAVRRALGCWP